MLKKPSFFGSVWAKLFKNKPYIIIIEQKTLGSKEQTQNENSFNGNKRKN